jgi:glyoxylase-like metal-dependent hydrolase (beta-lactamase superfamily II)
MVRSIGVLVVLSLLGSAKPASAQLDPLEVQQVRPNLFLLNGGAPGAATTVVFVRSKDVVIIDAKGPRSVWGEVVAAEVKRLTKLPITTIINTDGDGDKVAGNIALANRRLEIVSQERAATDMRRMTMMFTTPAGLPTRTFKDRLTLGSGPDRIELSYLGAGHCHADTFVVIPALRILLTGSAFGEKSLPALVRPSGGNGVAYPETLTKALALTRDVDTIITARGGLAKPRDLEVHRDFMRDFVENARRAKKAGRTAAEAAKAWRVPPRYVGYTAGKWLLGTMETVFRQLP